MFAVFNCITFTLLAYCVSGNGLQGSYYPPGYKGCYTDMPDRILDKKFTRSALNSAKRCKQYCHGFRHRYAGTEFGNQCFCGDELKDYKKRPDSDCDMECTGNPQENCGETWMISVYDNLNILENAIHEGNTTEQERKQPLRTTIQPLTQYTQNLDRTTTVTTKSGAENTQFKGFVHHTLTILLHYVVTTAFH